MSDAQDLGAKVRAYVPHDLGAEVVRIWVFELIGRLSNCRIALNSYTSAR